MKDKLEKEFNKKFGQESIADMDWTTEDILDWWLSRFDQELQEIVKEGEGKKKEVELHECPEALCLHYNDILETRTEGFNHGIEVFKQLLIKRLSNETTL